jgi:hypothetical protein
MATEARRLIFGLELRALSGPRAIRFPTFAIPKQPIRIPARIECSFAPSVFSAEEFVEAV